MPVCINSNLCVDCQRCVRDCVFSVFAKQNGKIMVKNESSCILCGHCEAVCPTGAISVQESAWSLHEFYRPQATPVSSDAFVRLSTERRSIRQFQNKSLDESVLRYLLETARYSPTGVNRQNLKYIVLQNSLPALKALIFGELLRDPEKYATVIGPAVLTRIIESAKNNQDNLFFSAPAVIVVLDQCGKQIDGALAVAHIVLLAETLGIGTCINGIFPKIASTDPVFSSFLSIPAGYGIVTSIAIGYPNVEYMRIPVRKPADVLWK